MKEVHSGNLVMSVVRCTECVDYSMFLAGFSGLVMPVICLKDLLKVVGLKVSEMA